MHIEKPHAPAVKKKLDPTIAPASSKSSPNFNGPALTSDRDDSPINPDIDSPATVWCPVPPLNPSPIPSNMFANPRNYPSTPISPPREAIWRNHNSLRTENLQNSLTATPHGPALL